MNIRALWFATAAAALPLAATAQNWTGPYVGAQVGYANQDIRISGVTFSGEGAVYGIFAGYDYDFGQFVLGGEVDYVDGSYNLTSTAPVTPDGFENMTRIKARFGYDSGQFLPYAVIGYAWLNTTGGTNFDGLVFGVGGEYSIASNVSVGLEVLSHDLDDGSASGFETDPVTVSARLSYRF